MPSAAITPPADSTPPAGVRLTSGSWLRDLAVLVVVAGLWFCSLLGLRPLSNPDEGRYAEIPREMAVTGDFVTPRLDGVKYFEKPPLAYWLTALTFRHFGVSEFTARLWVALFALIGVLGTYAAARVIYGRGTGIWAAIVLSTSLLYYVLSQIILLDMAVAVTMSGALFAFILAMREPPGRRRLGLLLVFYACMALATLSKGLIGIAIPGAVIFLWVLVLNRWRDLWPFYPVVGTGWLLAIAAPWHLLAARANPDFLNFYFIHEHWLRFTTRIHGRYEPWWFFLPVLLVGLFPWVFFAWQAVRAALGEGWQARRQHAEAWFLVIWVVFIVAFFSKSQSKLIPYILPVFPALAVLIGHHVAGMWQGRPGLKYRLGGGAFILSALCLAAACLVAPAPADQPAIAAWLPVLRIALGGTLLVGAAFAFHGWRREQPRCMLSAITLSSTLFLFVVNLGGGAFDKASTKNLAMILKPMLQTGDRVYSVGCYAQDLPVYLGRLVSVVDFHGELEFGINAEPALTAARFLEREDLPGQWAQAGAAYAVIRRSSYAEWFASAGMPHDVIAETPRFVLVAKRDHSF
ncbi:MAG: glycosyltransferase family 39 protein [Verrucomicrobia bacterium]|nr:glycosyltransferase family 39 protein [Verrucomicrobiota bacterium]